MAEVSENVKVVLESISKLSQDEQNQVFAKKNAKLDNKDKTINSLRTALSQAQATIKTNTFKETVAKAFKETKDFNHDYTLEAMKLADITQEDTEAQIKEKVANLLNNDKYKFLKQQAEVPTVPTVNGSVNQNLNEKPVRKQTLHL